MQVGDGGDQAQPVSRHARPAPAPVEPLRHELTFLRSDARAVVTRRDQRPAVLAGQQQVHGAPRERELQGVVDEVHSSPAFGSGAAPP
jgi:hypothetical protein